MFSKGESVLRKHVMDDGFYLSKPGGLFRKITREGVSDVLGRWIMDGWLRIDGRERERGAGREQCIRGSTAIAGGEEVTSARG